MFFSFEFIGFYDEQANDLLYTVSIQLQYHFYIKDNSFIDKSYRVWGKVLIFHNFCTSSCFLVVVKS